MNNTGIKFPCNDFLSLSLFFFLPGQSSAAWRASSPPPSAAPSAAAAAAAAADHAGGPYLCLETGNEGLFDKRCRRNATTMRFRQEKWEIRVRDPDSYVQKS